MPLRGKNPESHVLAAAAAQESTMKILQAARPQPIAEEPRGPRPPSSFIEDVEAWVRKYLNLADEVLQTPAEPEVKAKEEPAA